ncbi:MAG: hypothetical protein HYS12_00200, partial [Planctomycetes bacterium]|nr:hypothetical protein [Planctomycetota bacterium]
MAQVSPPSPGSPSPAPASGAPSTVRLDVRTGTSTVTSYAVGEIGFLLGSVPGCDLRLPGSNLPPVLALIARQANGASVRKLAPIGGLLLNGHPVTHSPLQDGDRITFGPVEITVSLSVPAPVPVMRVRLYDGSEGPAEAPDRLLRERAEKLAEVRAELEHREETLREERNDLAVQRNEIAERTEQLAKQAEDLNGVRREMTELRQRLYQRYRQGRDRLAGLQQSVRRAARRLQERKRRFEAELLQARALTSGDGDPRTELTA